MLYNQKLLYTMLFNISYNTKASAMYQAKTGQNRYIALFYVI